MFTLKNLNGLILQMNVNVSRPKKFKGDTDKFCFASQALHKRHELARKRKEVRVQCPPT